MHRHPRYRTLRRGLLGACLALAFFSSAAGAAILVRIAGIPGDDLLIKGYDSGEWFSVDSGSYGTERLLLDPGVKGGTTDLNIGIGDLLPIGLSGGLGRSTAKLAQAAVNGNALADAEIHLAETVDPEGSVFVFGKIRLTKVFVVDCGMSGDADGRPRFEFRLLYNEIEIENIVRDPEDLKQATAYTTTWNLVTNTGGYKVEDGSRPNTPPTILSIPDQVVDEDGALTFQISVKDADGPAADLTVTGRSKDTAILLDSGIVISGEGAFRTVAITPRQNRNGVVPVSLVVSDGIDTVGTTFNLAVTPSPDPPAIAELGAKMTKTTEVAFTIPIDASDPDQSTETLVLTAKSADPATLPNSALAFAYDGGWELEIDPMGSQAGTTVVTVEVEDDTGQRAARSFTLTINGPDKSAPSSIAISNDSVDENAAGPIVIGTLSALDPDGDTSFTFVLLDSAGGKFQLAGSALSTAPGVTLDYEDASQHTLKLSATDGSGLTLVQSLTIQVANLNEAPTIALDFPASPDFVGTAFTVLGSQLMLADPDAGASPVEVSLSLVQGALTIDDSSALAGKVTGNGTRKLVIRAVLADISQTIEGGGMAYTADPSVESDTLTVSVDDLGSTGAGKPNITTDSASFNVQPDPLRLFLDEFFTPAEQADPKTGGLLGDADGDELNTLLEFKLGTNPRDARDGKQSIELTEVEIDGEFYTRISFIQRTDASTPHTSMSVRVASAVSGWKPGSEVLVETSRDPLVGDRERITLRSIAPRRGKEREFYQLFVEHDGSVN